MSARYAIYAAPGIAGQHNAATVLRSMADAWLGRSVTSVRPAPLVLESWTRQQVDAITNDARRYGFHATLKAPFRLAEGRSADDLATAVAEFAGRRGPVVIPRVVLGTINGFFALQPGSDALALEALAADVVRSFDDFRAPPQDAEIARRRPDLLAPRERELLQQWGYPYVFDRFRFHLTLTDRIPAQRRPAVETVLREWFHDVLGHDVPIEALAVFVELRPGEPFVLHSWHPLTTCTSETDGKRTRERG